MSNTDIQLEYNTVHKYTNIQQDATMVSCFITRSLYVFLALSASIIILTTVMGPSARFWTTLKVDVTIKLTIQRNICYASDCQLQLIYS
jgi:hypothetical protein